MGEEQFRVSTAVQLEEVNPQVRLYRQEQEGRRVQYLDPSSAPGTNNEAMKVGHSFMAEITQAYSLEDVWVCDVEDIEKRNGMMKELRDFYHEPDNKERYKVSRISSSLVGKLVAVKGSSHR